MKTVVHLAASTLALSVLLGGCVDDDPDEHIPDASQSEHERDAGVVPLPVACRAQTDCSAEQVCAAEGYCRDRCDDAGVCTVVAGRGKIASLLADGPILYVAIGPGEDRFGNVISGSDLYTLVGDGPLTHVASEEHAITLLESSGDYLYWHAVGDPNQSLTTTSIRRMRKAGDRPSEGIYPSVKVEHFVLGPAGSLALRTAEGLFLGSSDGTAELRKLVDIGECTAPLGGGSHHCGPIALTSDAVFYESYESRRLVSTSLQTGERADHGPTTEFLESITLAPPYLYVPSSWPFSALFRRDLSQPAAPDFTVYRTFERLALANGRGIQRHGDWLYMFGSAYASGATDSTLFLERAAALGAANVQRILPAGFSVPSNAYLGLLAVGEGHAFFTLLWLISGQWTDPMVYRVPLPAAP